MASRVIDKIDDMRDAADRLAAACKVANEHNRGDSIDTLQMAFHELVAELWNLGFKPSEIKAALKRVEGNRFITGPEI